MVQIAPVAAYVFFCGGNLNSDKIEHLILYLDC